MKDILLILATWRLSHLIASEHEPTGILSWIRHKAGVQYNERSQMYATSVVGQGMLCQWCNSVWIGWFVAFVAYRSKNALILGLSYSAGSILIQELLDYGTRINRNAS